MLQSGCHEKNTDKYTHHTERHSYYTKYLSSVHRLDEWTTPKDGSLIESKHASWILNVTKQSALDGTF